MRHSAPLQCWRPVTAALALASVFGVAHAQAPQVDTLVVRFFDDNPKAAGTLSPASLAELSSVLGVAVDAAGRTRDGAHRLSLARPLPIGEARDAVNRVRATGAVVYAEIDEPAPRSKALAADAAASADPVQRLIVRYRDGAATLPPHRLARIEGAARQRVVTTRAMSGGAHAVALSSPMTQASAQALAASVAAADADIEHVEPDRRALPQAIPNDPLFTSQWNLSDAVGGVDAPAAWDVQTGSPHIAIALLDSGRLPHPDLAGRYVGGYDFVSDPRFANDGDGRDADPTDPGDWLTASEALPGSPFAGCAVTDSTWHGTQVAGMLGAVPNNGAGVTGVNWSSPIVPVRVMGKCGAAVSDIADAIRWAAGLPVPGVPANPRPARVLNMSLSGRGACGETLQSAVNAAIAAGSVIVVAAGNQGDDAANYFPGNCNGVITVAGTGRNGARAPFSNFGARVALAAPSGGTGIDVTTTYNAGARAADASGYGYAPRYGTSLSAPHVAGAASLLLGADPSLTPAEVLAILQRTARAFATGTGSDCTSATCGAGVLQIAAALHWLSPSSVPPVTTAPTPPASSDGSGAVAASPPPTPAGNPRDWRSKAPDDLGKRKELPAVVEGERAIRRVASRL